MNTKLAIEILSESHNEITAFLVGLGLLENESVMTELEVEFEAAFTIFLDEYGELKNNFVIASSEVERVEEDLIFANDYHRIQEERLQGLLAKQDALNREIEIFEEQKESIENFSDEEKLVIESNIAQIEQDIENTETELEELRQNPNTNKELIDALESEWNSHILRYQLQKDLLSLSDLDLTQKLDLVKLQIEQQREDLGTLTQKIIEQESIVNDAKNNLSSIQANLEQLNATETSAETALNKFEVANGYLLAEDVTDFLDWNINEASPDVVKLWQQVLAVKGEEIISERLTSLTSQESSEEAVNIALEQDRNEDYIVLGAELAKEIGNLSEIWLENLEESHQLTVNVWNLSQQRTDAVNGLETYIEDNLASPEGEYVLDKIQLEEAIAREEAQVEYADALTYSVDSLEDAIEVLTTQQQQVEVLSKKIEHISILTNLENQYATLGNQASKELRLELIEILNEELNLKIQDFTIKINLINEQQELWLENELQEYINQKQNQIIDIKNQHLSSINITQTNLAFSSEQYGFNALNITSAYFGRGYDHLPRFMADVNGDGRADFGRFEGGGHIPISLYFNLAGENGFIEEIYQLSPGTDIGYNHLPRFMSDVNGDGRADFGRFVGGGNGTPIHLSFVLAEENGFSSQEYGFNTIKAGFDKGYDHLPRFMADVNGDGRADFGRFVGGGNGTPIHLSFALAEENGFSSEQYGFNALNITSAYFGRGYDHLPRFMADVNGDGRADFGRFEGGGHIPISLYFNLAGENGFIEEIYQLSPGTDIGYNHLPRFMSDVNGDGRADFGRFVGGGNGTPIHLSFVLAEENGFSSQEYGFNTIKAGFDKGYDHLPRFMADVNGDGRADFGRFIGGGNGTPIHLSFNLAESAEDELELIQPIEEQAISDLQNLRVETTYLTLQAEQNPDKLQQYLEAFQASDKTEATVNNLRNQYYPALSEATTLYNLQQQINDELTNSQQELETLKTLISQKQANATAALSQADWYEDQAQIHWDLSRKAGPTWNEYRTSKGSCGRTETITVTHVDHHWIIWDTYQKQATNLRQYAANLDEEIIENTHQQVLNDQLITQWMDANEAADEAELTLDQFIEQLEILQAQRELLPQQVAQLETFSNLLPALQEQLAIAQLAAKEAKVATATELAEYKTSSHEYQTAFNDVLSKKASLETETQNLLQQIANTRAWILQQSLYLDTELSDTIKLKQQLQTQIDAIAIQTSTAETETEIAQLQQSVDLLINKQIILTSQQAALTQQNTLLEAQTTVIETEYQLLLATIESPDNDYSNLEGQLLEAQNALEEIQTLAQQAEASSIALTTSIEDLQGFLQLQNDQYLASIQTQQQILQELVDATELQENYTLLATEKQLELNSLESQLQTRLIEATEAGSTEAAYLLEVASANNFATAAEIYYEDYRDLMTDTGGGCAGGIARPEDGVKADYYYNEMLRYQALQEQAQQQADHFAQVKEAAQDQIDLIQQQTEIAQVEFQDLQASLNTTQENIEDLEQQLNIAELRIDALEYLRNWTEQTSIQLLQVEQLNLAQATLEQEFAQQRQLGIDETITAQFEKQQAGIERDRAIAVAKLEQLNQLQAEDVLQQALNDLRSDLGLQPIEDIIQEAEYFGQLAGILSDLENLQAETELPENIRTILAETTADIEDALQGREAATIEENLLNSANALITEANLLQTEIATLDEEEVRLSAILEQSETDLQGATKALYDEIINNQELGAETDDINQDYLEVLYQIGYAEGAVDLSSTLAQQSKDILDEIIEGRIIEREARKKAFINELFGTITLVLSVAAAAITAGASLAATAFVQPTISVTLSSISAGLSAVQSAYNGDWSGAIFNAGIAGLGFAHVGGFDLPSGTQIPGVEDFLDVQRVAEGAYSAYQAAESGDNISALLNIFSAALPITGLEQYNYLSQAALSIHGGVQLAEEGEWLAATSNFLNAAFSLGSELNGQEGSFNIDLGLSPQILNIISLIEVGTNIINGIKGITEDGSLEGLLNGIKTVADGFTTYYSEQQTIDQLTNFKQELLLQNILQQPDITNEEIQNLASKYGLENIFVRQEKNGQEQIYITREFELNQNNQGGLITRGEIDPNQATILVTFGWLNNVSPDWNFDVAELLESKYPNHNIIIGDWSELAQDINYFSAASDTKLAGQEIAKQLHELQIDFSQLQIIGHSLGAQVAGAIGEYAKENYYTEVSTIIGLDPASPGFERNTLIFLPYSSNERRLDDSDADNVILVRSDYEGLFPRGYTNPLGDLDIKITREVLDFYINSDPSQQNPYLIDNPSVGPDHSVAFEFLIDALNQGFSLDNLDQFLQVRQEQLPSELDYTTDKSNHLNNLRSILNSDDITVTYNNPLPYFLKSSEYSLGSYQIATNDIVPLDPIIIDLDGNGLELSDLSTSSIFFDIDADGYAENTAWTTDSILTFDLNQDGIINNISEVFSEYFNDGSPNSGLDALATLDSNQNGIISATDSQFDQILVWLDINQDGISQPDELKPLSDHGITSISLNGITTETIQEGNIIKKRSIFNRNDGTSGEISDVAFLVTQTGFIVNQTDTGIEILAEDDTAVSLLIHEQTTDLTLNLADSNLQVAIGNIGNDFLYTTANNNDVFLSGETGNDTLVGSEGDDWLLGDEGEDNLQGGAGDDLLYIDAQDTLIDGGDGTDIAIVTTADALTLDLGTANLEMVIGNNGDDIFTHSDNYTVIIDGGEGNDQLTGGNNDDVLTGGIGDDLIYGNDGNDRLEGGDGLDILYGSQGNDSLNGGEGIDTAIFYGIEHDFNIIYEGSSTIVMDLNPTDGDEGINILTGIENIQFVTNDQALLS